MFRNQQEQFRKIFSPHQTKKNIFRFLDPNKKIFPEAKIILDFQPKQKKYFWDSSNPNKKKKIFLDSLDRNKIIIFVPGEGHFHRPKYTMFMTFHADVFAVGRLFHQQSRSWKWNKMFRNQQKQFLHPNKNIFRFLDPKKRNIFQIPRPKQKKYFCIPRSPNKKNIFGFLDPNKKNIFRFLNPNKKNNFRFLDPNKTTIFRPEQGIFMTKYLLLFVAGRFVSSAGRLFHQQKVGHGNETKCFGISRNNFFAQTKNIFRFLDPNKKIYFQIPRPNQIPPNKKNIFLDSTQTKKNIFLKFIGFQKKKKNIFGFSPCKIRLQLAIKPKTRLFLSRTGHFLHFRPNPCCYFQLVSIISSAGRLFSSRK